MTDQRQNHVFLSYSEENEAFVEALARRLQTDARLSFWFRPWHAIPGKDLQNQMQQALLDARTCAVFVSSGEIKGWQSEQMRAAIQARVDDDPEYRVIPVILPGTARPRKRDLPPFLRLHEAVEFEGPDDERAFRYLLAGILGIPPIDVEGFLEAGGVGTPDHIPEREKHKVEKHPLRLSLRIDPVHPPVRVLRDLLTAAFTAETLRRFCKYSPNFHPVTDEFSPNHGLNDMVEEVLDYCTAKLLWDELLAEVARENPRQYARFEPQLRGETGDLQA